MAGTTPAVSGGQIAGDDRGGAAGAKPLAAAAVAVSIWGATPFATKLAVAGLDPLAVGLLRTLLGALIAVPLLIAAARSRRDGTFPLAAWPGGTRPLVAVSGVCGFVLFPLLFTLGMGLTGAGRGALILGALPVLTGLVAAMVERRAPTPRWWLGCGLAMLGIALLVGERLGFSGGRADTLGGLLVVASALCAATGYVAGARAARVIGSWTVTLCGLVLGGLVVLPVTALLPLPGEMAAAPALTWGALIYLALGSSILGYAAWYWALGQGGIARTGLLQFLQPLVGLLLAVAILGEALTWPMAAAACAVLGGVAIARARKQG